MLPWESRSARQQPRARSRKLTTDLEALEGRQLLANTALGYSLPDLRVSGTAGTVASWGGSLGVTVTVQNLGASTMLDPLALAPGSESTADAPSTQVTVYISPRRNSLVGAYKLGSIAAPALAQNDLEEVSSSFTLPSRPAGFPKGGGKFYVSFLINPKNSILESNSRNNLSSAVPVRVVNNYLPLLDATELDVPDTMQPGDTIKPTFKIANLGTAPTRLQGKVQVALVASVDKEFTVGSSIVGIYDIDNIASLSNTPIRSYFRSGRVNARNASLNNLTNNNNVVTISGDPVTLPVSPKTYYLGIVIDPYNKLNQLPHSGNRFQLIRTVGPGTGGGLPPAGTVTAGGGVDNAAFPSLPSGGSIGIS